jgi:K+-sensing histidine kinase KdpD
MYQRGQCSGGVNAAAEANGTCYSVVAIILAVTTVLFYFNQYGPHHHLVFFYLLPTAFVAIVYGSVLSMLCAIMATLVAAFFLYDPIYSLYVSDARRSRSDPSVSSRNDRQSAGCDLRACLMAGLP